MTNLKQIEAQVWNRLNVLSRNNWAKEEQKFIKSKKFEKALLYTLDRYDPFESTKKYRELTINTMFSDENYNWLYFYFYAFTDGEFRKYRNDNLDAVCHGKCTIEPVIPYGWSEDDYVDNKDSVYQEDLDEPLKITLDLWLMSEEDMEGHTDIPDDYEPDIIELDSKKDIKVDDFKITYDEFLGKKLRKEFDTYVRERR